MSYNPIHTFLEDAGELIADISADCGADNGIGNYQEAGSTGGGRNGMDRKAVSA